MLELEFMAFLIDLERWTAQADASARVERLEVCRSAQQRFLKEHLAWWAPGFSVLLAREAPQGFYVSVGIFLAALIAAERALLGVETPENLAGPSTGERPDECEGCILKP